MTMSFESEIAKYASDEVLQVEVIFDYTPQERCAGPNDISPPDGPEVDDLTVIDMETNTPVAVMKEDYLRLRNQAFEFGQRYWRLWADLAPVE